MSRSVRLALLFVLFLTAPAYADDPRLDYHTITTPHFYVHYHDGTEDFAWKVAVTCEEAHLILTPLLNWVPAGRTHVVVNDQVDVANGSASVYGRKQINVFAMPPESDSVLGFYDDWIRVLVFHEYVHVLHLDTVGGIPPYVNAIIGNQWFPNQTLPRWYVEGLATYYESAQTRGGRVDGSLFKMYLRAAALDGAFFDLGTASGIPTHWPGGTAAYLYGGFFLDYVLTKYGDEFGPKFNELYGRRVLPWALNSLARDISGETFEELWHEFAAAESGRAVGELIRVRAVGETRLDPITTGGGQTGWPRARPGTNQIWFYHFDHESDPTYSSVLTTGNDVEERFPVEAGAGASDFTPDGRLLVYAQQTVFEASYRFLDLYAYDIQNGTRRRLTYGERARDPAISVDGKIAYARNRGGTMELVVRPFPHTSGPEQVLVTGLSAGRDEPLRWQQIATPDFSPDGRRLVFSWWRQDSGHRDLWIYDFDAAGEKLRPLTDDFAVDVDPHWAPDGLVYFSSDRNGIYNIYSANPDTGEVRQVSNVRSGVFSPQVTPDGQWVFASTYGAEGFDLARFPLPEAPPPAGESRVERGLSAIDYPAVDTTDFHTSPYRASRWLGPLLLKPQLGVVTTGAGFGAAIEGYDPLPHHAWQISAGYTTGLALEDRSANFGASYAYGGLPVGVSLSGLVRDYSRTRSLFVESDYLPFLEREYLGRLRLSYSFRELVDTLTVAARFDVDYTTFQNVPPVDHDPADLEPALPEQGWFNEFALSLGYSSRESYPQSISAQKGWSATVSLDVQDPAIGSDFHALELSYGFDLFVPNPLWDRHVLAFLVDGAIALSERRSPRRYAIGGNRPQDVLTSAVLQTQRRDFVVRGYPPSVTTGSQYQVLNLEYRFPILDLDEGFSTVPVFLRRIKGAAFMDTGGAFDGFLADADYLTGVGAEVIMESVFAYYLFGNFTVGYARGLDEGGINEFYFLFGGGF